MTRGWLDSEIASGTLSGNVDALALRVRQLTRERTRRRLASNLRGVVEYVDRKGHRPVISAVVIEPAAVSAGRRAILDLAATLEGNTPVRPGGIVLAQKLMTDGASPLFNPDCDRSVTEVIREIEEALEGGGADPWAGRN